MPPSSVDHPSASCTRTVDDKLAVLLEDVSSKARHCEARLAEHRHTLSSHIESERRRQQEPRSMNDQNTPAAVPSGSPDGTGNAIRHARALRNLSKKVHIEAQRLVQLVYMSRQAQAAASLQRRSQLEGAAQQQKQSQQVQSPLPRQHYLYKGGTTAAAGGVAGLGVVASPARAQEHQQMALLMQQKADLTLELALRDQKISFQEQHIALLEAEVRARLHCDSASSSQAGQQLEDGDVCAGWDSYYYLDGPGAQIYTSSSEKDASGQNTYLRDLEQSGAFDSVANTVQQM